MAENALPLPEAAPDARTAQMGAASQWQLIWWSFRKHRMAMVGGVVTLLIYFIAAVPHFFAINDPLQQNARAVYHPPDSVHLFAQSPRGGWSFSPHVNAMVLKRDPVTLAPTFQEDAGR